MTPPVRILLTGQPAVGKTTVVRRFIDVLRSAGVAPVGFVTEELRVEGRRVGFVAQDLTSGVRARIADAERTGPPRVGRYGVDVPAFDSVALPALSVVGPLDVLVIDEIGGMELLSEAFVARLDQLLATPVQMVATVHAATDPVTDRIIAMPGLQVVTVSPDNRDGLPAQLASWIGVSPSEGRE
ncbi:MAG TPA: nucleoside-triphosphatase [Mycobacteriales bacterium]|nr:nucleoside-triphosphatase [Mycobacteriales bacterium]